MPGKRTPEPGNTHPIPRKPKKKEKPIMNEANAAVREAARDLVVEILAALGVPPQEVESHFRERAAGAALELRLTQFAGAILEQAKAAKSPGRAIGVAG
jgi:hypothetical protein